MVCLKIKNCWKRTRLNPTGRGLYNHCITLTCFTMSIL